MGVETKRGARTRSKPALPRVPLPRQIGGVHEDKTKRPPRRAKHKKRVPEVDRD